MGKIFKGLAFGGDIDVCVIDTTDVVNKAIDIHGLSPLCAAALGRALTATAFMASSLKNESDRLSITITGDGVGGQIVTCSDSALDLRGYIENPHAELPLNAKGKLDVRSCVGTKGRISVVKSMGLKEPYTGSCHLVSGELAEDFSAYYTYSEQVPTAMALGVKIGVDYKCVGAGGVILQVMPGAKEESIDAAEELIKNFSAISSLIEEFGVQGVCDKFFKDVSFTAFQCRYKCNCSKDYVSKMLLTLGKNELYDIIEKLGKIEVDCQFCPEKYTYYKEDVDKILNNGKKSKTTNDES